MNSKYLPIAAAMLAATCVHAQQTVAIAKETQKAEPLFALNVPATHTGLNATSIHTPAIAPAHAPGPRYRSREGVRAVFFLGLELGYGQGDAEHESSKGMSKGVAFHAQMGGKVFFATRATNRFKMLALSAAYGINELKEKYSDINGNSATTQREIKSVTLPVSFTAANFGRNGGAFGYYWELGTNIGYIAKMTDDDNKVADHYKRFYAEPFISAGLSIMVLNTSTGNAGIYTIGPYFSEVVTDIAKDGALPLRWYTFGIKLVRTGAN